MIIGGKTRTDGKALGEYLGNYLQAEKNDRVEMIELTGSAHRSLTKAIASWEAEAKGSRCKKPLWHAYLRTPDGEHLTREQQLEAVNVLERHLGFATYDKDGKLLHRQSRAVVLHENNGHAHIHVVWSRIRRHDEVVETKRRVGKKDKTKEIDDRPIRTTSKVMSAGTAKATSHTKRKNVAAAREIEARFGLKHVDSPAFSKESPRQKRREQSASKPTYIDFRQSKRSGLDVGKMKKDITRIWRESDSGKALRAGLQEAGYTLAMGDRRSHVFVDEAGDIHSLPRFIEGALKKDVTARLRDLDPASIPRAVHVQKQRYFAWKERHPEAFDPNDSASSRKVDERASRTVSIQAEPIKPKRRSIFEEVEIDPRDPSTILKALTRTRSTFTEADLRWEVAKRLGEAAEPSAPIALSARVMALPEFVTIGDDLHGRRRHTSKAMIEAEKAMAVAAEKLSSRLTHTIRPETMDKAPSAEKLSEEQRAVTEYIIAPGALKLIEGIAGGGKSTTMRPFNEAAIAAGYRVRGLAVAGIAAQGLQDSTGIGSGTIMSFFNSVDRLQQDRDRLAQMKSKLLHLTGAEHFEKSHACDQLATKIDKATLNERDIIVLDEAGMVGSRQTKRLLEMAADAGAKVVMIGDSEQLQAIDAGGPFRFLAERHGAARISEVWRQRDGWQKQATRDFRDGETAIALQTHRDQGHVHQIEKGKDAREEVLTHWSESRNAHQGDSHLMLAFTNADVQALNERAREIYKSEGRLGAEDIVQTEDGPQPFATGDRLYFRQNSRMLQVMNGTLGTIEKLEKYSGKDEHRVTVRLDKGDRVVEFSTEEYRHVSHAYAVTVHKTQGATTDRALVLASPYMDRHATYVAMSRHIHVADLYYSENEFGDFSKLEQRLCREARKDTTLDYAQVAASADAPSGPLRRAETTSEESRPRPNDRLGDLIAMRLDPTRRDDLRAYRKLKLEELRDILRSRSTDLGPSSSGPDI